MAYRRCEQETTCVYDHQAGTWIVYSCVRKHMTKLFKRFGEPVWSESEATEEGVRVIAAKWTDVQGNMVRFAAALRNSPTEGDEREDD